MLEMLASAWPLIEKVINLGVAIVVTLVFLGLVIWIAISAVRKIHPLMMTQNKLIENNTKATEAVCQSVNILGDILKEVTTNFAVHDTRAIAIQKDISVLQADVSGLKVSAATKEELVRVHERIDNMGTDVTAIRTKVGC
ncbi:MAG: hypothetical protein P4N59_03350 [Negativicutes bacterium]|nr:hypothetical protein [Negativicutes bacterium]